MVKFKKELDYFIKEQDNLVKRYNGKTLAIKNHSIIGVFENAAQAFIEASKAHKPGTFMIQHCIPGPDAYTVTISSHNITF